MQVFNLTQSKKGLITAVSTTNIQNDTVVATLTGSASWAVGDSFEIPVSEYGTITDSDGQTTMVPSYLGTVGDLIPLEGNLLMDVARKPAILTVDNLDCFFGNPHALPGGCDCLCSFPAWPEDV